MSSTSLSWFFKSTTCSDLAPAIYDLTKILIIVNWSFILIPFILACALVPMFYCCLPCAIRIMNWVTVEGETGQHCACGRDDTTSA